MSMCPESFACQQTWRLVGEMRCYIRAHTRCCFDTVSLLVSRWKSNPMPQMLTVNILLLSTTHVGAWLSLHRLSWHFLFRSCSRCTFPTFWSIVVFLVCFLRSLEEILGDLQIYTRSLEADDSWLLGNVCDPTCQCPWGHCPGQWRHMWSDGEVGAGGTPYYTDVKSVIQTWRWKKLFSDIKHWLWFKVFSLSNTHCCQNCEASGDISLARFLSVVEKRGLVPCFQLDCVCVSMHLFTQSPCPRSA